jgi:hypothetical protein
MALCVHGPSRPATSSGRTKPDARAPPTSASARQRNVFGCDTDARVRWIFIGNLSTPLWAQEILNSDG